MLLAGVAVLACVLLCSAGPGTSPARAAGAGAKQVSGQPAAVTVHRVPFGLSIEYPLLERALGPGPCPDQALVSTLQELGSPPLRVGGDSQDLAGPAAAYHYFIPPSFFTTLGCLARETGAQVTVGLNLGDGTLQDARTMVAEAQANIPASQLSFSLGNEPDLYTISHPLWSEPGFIDRPFRGPSWTFSSYARQWMSWRAMLGPVRIEGPDLATGRWAAQAGRMLRADPPDQVSAHMYPTVASGPNASATPQRLLSRFSDLEQINQLGWLLGAARAVHRPAVISESNSASRGGKPGLSDSPVASIWAVRFVIDALLHGYQQVYFHSAGVSYDPFVFNPDGSLTARALASALSFLHRWIPVGSRLRAVAGPRDLFAVTVVSAAGSSMILTSFARKEISVPVTIGAGVGALRLDTLTTTSALDIQSVLPLKAHRIRLWLAPNTVLAVRTA
jgi:hypothetical protein